MSGEYGPEGSESTRGDGRVGHDGLSFGLWGGRARGWHVVRGRVSGRGGGLEPRSGWASKELACMRGCDAYRGTRWKGLVNRRGWGFCGRG